MKLFYRCLVLLVVCGVPLQGLAATRSDVSVKTDTTTKTDSHQIAGHQIAGHQIAQISDDDLVLRFAVLGDAEPKPKAEFPGLAAAVADINRLAAHGRLDFVIGVGDIAHKGTELQYQQATRVLQQLKVAFYPIMGNEEHGSTVARFLSYANRWNQRPDGSQKAQFSSPAYVLDLPSLRLIMASPDFGRDFSDQGIRWLQQQLAAQPGKPAMLVVHAAQQGVYPAAPAKGVSHPGFTEVLAAPDLVAVLSGDLHLDMDRAEHSKVLGRLHYLHMPGLERTKVPDDRRHTPMFRVLSLGSDGIVRVDTYQTGLAAPLARHHYQFSLRP